MDGGVADVTDDNFVFFIAVIALAGVTGYANEVIDTILNKFAGPIFEDREVMHIELGGFED